MRLVTKVDKSSDMVGHGIATTDDPMWGIYIYNNDKENPKRLKIDILKSEVKTIILKHVDDPSGLAERWTDMPKKKYSN